MTDVRNLSWLHVQEEADRIAHNLCDLAGSWTNLRIFGVPRGGVYAALLVAAAYRGMGRKVTIVEDPSFADVIIDDIICTGKTAERFRQAGEKVRPFYALYTKGDDKRWYSFPWERGRAGEELGIEDHIVRVLEFLGEDVKRDGLKDTPMRVVKSWTHLFSGYKQNPADVFRVFECPDYNEMVVLKNIEFYSTCEHHMLPFFGRAHIGYIPDGKVVGISKIARLLEIFSRRLQIQEQLAKQVVDALQQYLSPQGCGCVLEAQHLCMTARGVQKQNSVMVTSAMRGTFLTDSSVKDEFLREIKR